MFVNPWAVELFFTRKDKKKGHVMERTTLQTAAPLWQGLISLCPLTA